MAEIVTLVPKKWDSAKSTALGSRQPFQLLFFTGVQYERNFVVSHQFSKPVGPEKLPLRKRIRKA